VDDTGVGIDEADLPRVFDVAYRGSNDRVPRSDSSLPSGSGLGLAIAAGLVQAHRGTLPARGSRCGCRWPRTSDSPALTARVAHREDVPRPGHALEFMVAAVGERD